MAEFEDDELEGLLVEVRAGTSGFAQDIAEMRGLVDGALTESFTRAGNVLERGLVGAIRRGNLGFADLRRMALRTIDEIAAQAVRNLFSGGIARGGGLLDFGGLVGSLLGLPGRATGGPVAPGRGYLIGEDGPEVFVPTSAGRVETIALREHGQPVAERQVVREAARLQPIAAPEVRARDVRVSISVVSPRGSDVPRSLQRSTRQLASAVRRALAEN